MSEYAEYFNGYFQFLILGYLSGDGLPFYQSIKIFQFLILGYVERVGERRVNVVITFQFLILGYSWRTFTHSTAYTFTFNSSF